MPRIVTNEMVEPVTRVLLGAIDTGDGGTDEQRAVLAALVAGYWERPEIDLGALSALDPDEAAAAVTDPAHRRRVRELMVLLESCRHPLTKDQVVRVEAYAAVLHEQGPGLTIVRDLVNEGAQQAMADYMRFMGEIEGELAEPTLRADYLEYRSFVGKTATLQRDVAVDLLAEGLRRGAQCTGDFTSADHLALAATPLEEVRERYEVPARA